MGDVAEACVRVLADPSTQCRVYEIGGPQVYAYKELVQLVLEGIGRRTVMIPVPFLVWDILAAVTAFHPDPPLTRRSGETDEAGQCRREAGVDPG